MNKSFALIRSLTSLIVTMVAMYSW